MIKIGALTRVIVGVAAYMVVALTPLVSMAPIARADSPQQPPVITIDFSGPSVATEITRNDGVVNPSVFLTDPRPGIGEIGQVSPNCVTGKDWDLMGFGLQPNITPTTSAIWMVSGFDPRTSNEGFSFGGLFIDTDGHFNKNVPRPVNADGYQSVSNRQAGFEYAVNVIGVNDDTLTYQLVHLSPDSTLQTCYYQQNDPGGPWKLISSSVDSVIFTKTTEVKTAGTLETLLKTGVNTGGVYDNQNIWSFELPNDILWKPDPDVKTKIFATLGCGNDWAVGAFNATNIPAISNISAVPETGNVFGVAILITTALSIRTRRPVIG